MRNIRYKYLFVILSVVFISTLENLYSQIAVNTYSLEINTNDIEIVKFINGYQIYLKKKPNVYGYRIQLKRQDGLNSYLYIDNSGNTNSIIRIRESDYHYKLGEVFKVFIPNNVYLDNRNNNSLFTLRDNTTIILEAYNINNNTLINNEIILKANNNEASIPTITLRNVEKEGDLYAFYLYYSGGDNGEYAFYVREGKTNTSYKLIDTSYGNTGNYDSSGIVLEDTFNRVLGKKLYIKAYFKQLPEDRYLSFNVFNTQGESFTYPIDYVIETTNVKEEVIPPPMPSGGNEGPVKIRPSDRVIETSTNTIIVKKDTAPPVKESNEIKILSSANIVENPMIEKPEVEKNMAENNFNYNLEAMNNLNNASKSFNTPNNYVNNTDELSDKFRSIIERYKNEGAIDLVIVLDTTESMHPYLKTIKRDIRGMVTELFDNHKYSRVGFLLYRDVKDTYLTKKIDFSDNINFINREVNYFYATGGGDKAEPMYEALQEALETFDYINQKRLVIVLTDAPAKVIGRADLDLNLNTAKMKNVTVEFILASEIEEEEDFSDDYLYFLNF
ncbi:vWA domain-containing protein [Brachyspira hyodysenteriae]|uniref:vWA domain-containing protein n=1 Tax=Brachyspira hyodysenteriae TaxID=159 RepID=UPI00063D986B|nr:vWA domain-containing protein [Brachyspira hyodysenteriae]KLI40346.1 von Willebrand factor A [Brachyspira hyodysenteriae]